MIKKDTLPVTLVRPLHRLALVTLMLAVLGTLSGCGTTNKVTSQQKASVGQQLLDLEKAHNQGVITDKEYAKLKKRLIKDND